MKARANWALAALLCVHCADKDRIAGGYDDVENPAIQVALVDTLGNPYLVGGAAELRVYARYQNPAKDSLPLLKQSIAADTFGLIRDSVLLAAMAEAAGRGTPWPSRDTVEFNLTVSATGPGMLAAGAEREAFVGDFLLAKSKDGVFRFRRRSGSGWQYPDTKGVLAARPVMAPPVAGQLGAIGDRGRQLSLQAVFIPGSPYAAKIAEDGTFSFARLARGKYDVKAVSSDAKIYTAQDSLAAGMEYIPSDWSEADILWIE
ncbi:MAG: hypothetical protein ABI036_16620 [Fibrobacteria bacterium]